MWIYQQEERLARKQEELAKKQEGKENKANQKKEKEDHSRRKEERLKRRGEMQKAQKETPNKKEKLDLPQFRLIEYVFLQFTEESFHRSKVTESVTLGPVYSWH